MRRRLSHLQQCGFYLGLEYIYSSDDQHIIGTPFKPADPRKRPAAFTCFICNACQIPRPVAQQWKPFLRNRSKYQFSGLPILYGCQCIRLDNFRQEMVVINMESLMEFTVTGYARPHNLRQPVNIMSMYTKPLFHLEAHIFRPRLRAANCRL